MALFETSLPLTLATPSEARIVTPSVTLDVHAAVGERRLVASETWEGAGGLSLRRYAHESLAAELLVFPCVSRVNEGAVDGGAFLVWRLLALTDTPPIDLRAVREPDRLTLEASPRNPLCAFARTWRGRGTRVSVGAPDEGMMTILEGAGWFPKRLSDQVEENCLGESIAPFGPHSPGYHEGRHLDGVGVELPPLLAGERVQAHLTVAWAKRVWIERRDYGTIDAVGMLDPRVPMAAFGVR